MLSIRTLGTTGDTARAVGVFDRVWGTQTRVVQTELLTAIAHGGGYVAGAFADEEIIGASFGFLAVHRGVPALHSHVTAIVPGSEHHGIGRALKFHQREWEVLGVHIDAYEIDFYGTMTDTINANDHSDRLVAVWPTAPDADRPAARSGMRRVEVPTPPDAVDLRRQDPAATAAWRQRLRSTLHPLIDAGGTVTGFTRDGAYVVHV